jgi:NADP-dependent 3-hydroxy acid dehydrogenase YdfG
MKKIILITRTDTGFDYFVVKTFSNAGVTVIAAMRGQDAMGV